MVRVHLNNIALHTWCFEKHEFNNCMAGYFDEFDPKINLETLWRYGENINIPYVKDKCVDWNEL